MSEVLEALGVRRTRAGLFKCDAGVVRKYNAVKEAEFPPLLKPAAKPQSMPQLEPPRVPEREEKPAVEPAAVEPSAGTAENKAMANHAAAKVQACRRGQLRAAVRLREVKSAKSIGSGSNSCGGERRMGSAAASCARELRAAVEASQRRARASLGAGGSLARNRAEGPQTSHGNVRSWQFGKHISHVL